MEIIQRNIACPACEYNLRGLYGPLVACPECGLQCDIAELVAAKWDKPWWKAPAFNLAVGPTAGTLLGLLGLLPVSLVASDAGTPWVVPLYLLVWIGTWSLLGWLVLRLFPVPLAIRVILLGHGAVLAYQMSIACFVLAVVAVADATRIYIFSGEMPGVWQVLITGIFLPALIGTFWLGRKAERHIAACCIRRHLARRAGTPV